MNKTLLTSAILVCLATTWAAQDDRNARKRATEIVAQVQRADYEGNRETLKKCYEELTPFLENKAIASRIRYWRGFDLWRSAINGFNDSVDEKELERLFLQGVDEFKEALALDPAFVDAKVGIISCLGHVVFIHRKETERAQQLVAQISPLVNEVKATAPDNPRFLWVLGPILSHTPVDRGGGNDKVIENYERGLAICAKLKTPDDPLEPSWGKPELLMSLAYTQLTKTPPDVDEAERDARGALEIVPYWHYARDILLKQIAEAKAKQAKQSP